MKEINSVFLVPNQKKSKNKNDLNRQKNGQFPAKEEGNEWDKTHEN